MEIRRRRLGATDRPVFTKEDAWFLLEFPVFFLVATFVPERHWQSVCYRLQRLKARVGGFSPAPIVRGMALMKGMDASASDAFGVSATRSEHHLQIIREFFWRWSAQNTLIGAERISGALAKRHGVVLWVAHFSFNALASKKALHAAGFMVSHLSRPEHGFSKSRFGIAFLNPIRIKTELRYLKDRIIIDRSRPTSAVQRARKRLEANQIISITAGAWEGSQVASVAINGCQFELSTGAPGLAYLTGATLLPVFVIRDKGTTEIRVVIEEEIPVDRSVRRDDALLKATQCFADRLEPFVAAYPLQWRDWEKSRALSP